MILLQTFDKKSLSTENVLIHLINKLAAFLIQKPDYKDKIKKVVLLNFKKQLDLTEFNEKSLLKSIVNRRAIKSELKSIIINIIVESTIINVRDLNLPDSEYGSIGESNQVNRNDILEGELKKIINQNTVLILADKINSIVAKILLTHNDIIGFYSKINSAKPNYKEIESPRKYLSMIVQIKQKAGRPFSANHQVGLRLPPEFLGRIDKKIRKVFFYGGDRYISDLKFKEYEKRGKCFRYDCTDGDYLINSDSSVFIFDNFDHLQPSVRLELFNNLENTTENKLIILRSDNYLNDTWLSSFKKIRIPSISELKQYMPSIFYLIIAEKSINKKINLDKKLWYDRLTSKALLSFYKSLRSIYELDHILENIISGYNGKIDPVDYSFWYELIYSEKLNKRRERFIKKEIEKKALSQGSLEEMLKVLMKGDGTEAKDDLGPKSAQSEFDLERRNSIHQVTHPFQFLRRENNKIKIIFDGKDVALKNEDLLGLHYLRLIIKYGENGLSYQDIENIYRDSILGINEKRLNDSDILLDGDENEENSILLKPVEMFEGYKLVDKKTIKMIRGKIEQLEEQITILETELRFEEVDIKRAELEKLNEYLNTSLNIKGKSRSTNTELEKSKRRVKKTITTAKNQIKLDNFQFYTYIDKSIILDKSKDKYFYLSNPQIDWTLDQ